MHSVISGLGVADQSRLLPSMLRRAAAALVASEVAAGLCPIAAEPVAAAQPQPDAAAAAGAAPVSEPAPASAAAAAEHSGGAAASNLEALHDARLFPPVLVESMLSFTAGLAVSGTGAQALFTGQHCRRWCS